MLEQNIQDQLKTVFKDLSESVDFVYHESNHNKQKEMLDLLKEVSHFSNNLNVVSSNESSSIPSFSLFKNGKFTGISFQGIPTGHEFTSLIVAVLKLNGIGNLPDQGIIDRIKNLKNNIKLKTYISLECTNCPAVVQALNVIAMYHDNFVHTMVDGAFIPDEMGRLKVKSVPSVMDHDDLISAGKISLNDLLEKLENKYGVEKEIEAKDLGLYDIAVIGGGPAGVSSAIYSARKGLKVVVLAERIGGQLQDTKGIENFIGTNYVEGVPLSNQLAQHMKEYNIDVLEHRRVEEIKSEEIKKLSLNTKETLSAKKVIVATGAQWRKLNVTGEKEYIGKGVAFCPHCDGPLYKGKSIAVIGGGNSGVEAAIDLAGIVKNITLIEFADELKADKVLVDKVNSLENVKVILNAETKEVLGDDDKVTGLKFMDRGSEEIKEIDLDGIFVQIGLVPNSSFLKGLVELKPWGEIIIDDKCRTSEKGILAAGDVTTVPYKQIVISMGEGSKAALTAFEELMLS